MLRVLFQMDPEEDIWIVSELMLYDEGPRKFLANCFLLLTPAEIKACRLACKQWNKFIVDDVWKSKRGRKQLDQKLEHRWKISLLCLLYLFFNTSQYKRMKISVS